MCARRLKFLNPERMLTPKRRPKTRSSEETINSTTLIRLSLILPTQSHCLRQICPIQKADSGGITLRNDNPSLPPQLQSTTITYSTNLQNGSKEDWRNHGRKKSATTSGKWRENHGRKKSVTTSGKWREDKKMHRAMEALFNQGINLSLASIWPEPVITFLIEQCYYSLLCVLQ
jgi:hypothetical protein